MGIPANKIDVIYNPVENFSTNLDKPIKTNEKYILYIGALIDQKGLLTLLKAAQQLPQIKFVIAGDGKDKEKYFTLVKKMNNVEFVGIVKGNKKIDLIKNSQFVIVPSEWWETFGIVVLEANSLGKIVLTSGLGGLSELIENGVNGFTFTPGDYLNLKAKIELIVDELKSNSHSKECINKMSMFSSEIFIKQMHQLYKSIL
jgi:glycosyltransferase involved in cell wall biosynthesis